MAPNGMANCLLDNLHCFMTLSLLIADADLNESIIDAMRRIEPALNFLTASEGGTRGLSDRHVLERGAAVSGVVVSHDRNTMPRELYQFQAEGHSSPGLIIVSQELDIGRAIEDLLLIWGASSDEELRDRVVWVPL